MNLLESIYNVFKLKWQKSTNYSESLSVINEDPINKVFSNPPLLSLILFQTGNPSSYALVNKRFYNATKNGIAHQAILHKFLKEKGLLSELLQEEIKGIHQFKESEENSITILQLTSKKVFMKANRIFDKNEIIEETKSLGFFDKLSKIASLIEESTLLDFYRGFYQFTDSPLNFPNHPQPLKENLNTVKQFFSSYSFISSIEKIEINNFGLTYLPPELKFFTSLKKIDLSHNQLSELCIEIVHIRALEILNLSSNRLTKIPKEISDLTNLLELDLSCNKIVEIPKEIGHCISLKKLGLFENQLNNIPKEISDLTNLKQLNLLENPLKEIPAEISNLNIEISMQFPKTNLKDRVFSIINLNK